MFFLCPMGDALINKIHQLFLVSLCFLLPYIKAFFCSPEDFFACFMVFWTTGYFPITSNTSPSVGLIVRYFLKKEWPTSISMNLASFNDGSIITEVMSLNTPDSKNKIGMLEIKNQDGR